jgi:hypothetical protein
MKLYEFLTDTEISTGYYDPAEDKVNARISTDTRKPLLTLKHLNRLKKMRALKKLEDLKRQDLLGVLYAAPDDAAGAGGSPF